MFVNHFAPHPFVTPTSVNTRDLLTDGVFELLEHVGIADLTTGALGRGMNTTPQAVLKRAGGRERLDRIVVAEFSRRWTRWCLGAGRMDDGLVALPRNPIELHAVVVWHALAELARGAALTGRPELSAAMDEARSAERRHLSAVLSQRLGRLPAQRELDGLVALTDGVRFALVRTGRPMSLADAEAAVSGYVDAVILTRASDVD